MSHHPDEIRIGRHFSRTQKLGRRFAGHYHLPSPIEGVPLWMGVRPERCVGTYSQHLPLDAVAYAYRHGFGTDDVVGALHYLPPTMVLMAVGMCATRMLAADAARVAREDVMRRLGDLWGARTACHLPEPLAAEFFAAPHKVHCRRLPTGLLHIRLQTDACWWPEAVAGEVNRRRSKPIYRALVRLRELGLLPWPYADRRLRASGAAG